jgi:hypothetical protein
MSPNRWPGTAITTQPAFTPESRPLFHFYRQPYWLGHICAIMKKNELISWVVVLALVTTIATLEIFGCHPIFNIGKYQVRWVGVEHMRCGPVAGGNLAANGHFDKITIYFFGPIEAYPLHK